MGNSHPEWADYAIAAVAIVLFVGYASVLFWVDLRVGLGQQLAVLLSAVSAVGGVGLAAFAHRSEPAVRRRLLFLGIQATIPTVPVLSLTETVDHAGFRTVFLICGAGIGVVGVLLMGTAALNPDIESSIGDTEAS